MGEPIQSAPQCLLNGSAARVPVGEALCAYEFTGLFIRIDIDRIVEDLDLVSLAEGFGVTELLVRILHDPFASSQESSEVDICRSQQTRPGTLPRLRLKSGG